MACQMNETPLLFQLLFGRKFETFNTIQKNENLFDSCHIPICLGLGFNYKSSYDYSSSKSNEEDGAATK